MLDWAGAAQASVIPFGGGSSVGGVEPRRDTARYKGAVTIDLCELGRVLEVDKTSRAARIEAGAFGPALEAQLKPHGLTLRHFPQSFECSTLGGWIATRSGGHFATLYTHIDDLVKSLRVITPMGLIETRRLPWLGRRAEPGPAADRFGRYSGHHHGASSTIRSRRRSLGSGSSTHSTTGSRPRPSVPSLRQPGVPAR